MNREQRLEALRREAARLERGETVSGAGFHTGPMPSVGYYGLPILKAPVWTWEVPLYFFVGGTAGGAAMLGAAFGLVGSRWDVASKARWVALAGSLISPALLISDLGRPQRFLNMLRVLKPQSPMSVGSWVLAGFGGLSAASVAGHWAADRLDSRTLTFFAHTASVGAALAGSVLATYTGVLLGVTAIPVWSNHSMLLPVHFGLSGMGSAVAMLELLGADDRGLNVLGLAVSGLEIAVGAVTEVDESVENQAMREGAPGFMLHLGGTLSGPVSFMTRLLFGHTRTGRMLAGLAFMTGAVLTRYGWIAAGRESADDPGALLAQQRRRGGHG